MDTVLVRPIALKMSQHNHSHLMIPFSNHRHIYYFVHIASIKPGRELVEYLSLHIIERTFRFCYYWRAMDTEMVRSKVLKTSHIIRYTKQRFFHPTKN